MNEYFVLFVFYPAPFLSGSASFFLPGRVKTKKNCCGLAVGVTSLGVFFVATSVSGKRGRDSLLFPNRSSTISRPLFSKPKQFRLAITFIRKSRRGLLVGLTG